MSHGAPGPWSESASVTTGVGTAAPPVGALVSNSGQATNQNSHLLIDSVAQTFGTGGSAGGYKLTAVTATVAGGTGTPTYTAHIFLADDGIAAEKSHRWMAERIWGEARVASEWSSESWMRAQVRRWIPKARALAEGGWRDLVPRQVPELWRGAPAAGPDP